MKITEDMILGDVLDKYPQLAEEFLAVGMHCLGCPVSRSERIDQACAAHGVDCGALLIKLNAALG